MKPGAKERKPTKRDIAAALVEREGNGVLTIKLDPCHSLGIASALLAKLYADLMLAVISSPDWNCGMQYGGNVSLAYLRAEWRWVFTERKAA